MHVSPSTVKVRSCAVGALALALVSVFVLCACSDPEPVKKVDLSRREEMTFRARKGEITYAYLPQYSHSVSYQRHHLLVEYLSEATGLTFRQVFPDTFDEHMNMVGQGLIDISFSNPFIYVKIAERYGARAFARVVEAGRGANFRGQIIVRRDNPDIRTIEDVKGQHWLAVDPSSAGGYLFALGHFAEHGIHREDFAEIAFAPGPGGKQEKVVLGVYSGRYGVGSIREGSLELLRDAVDISRIRVLATTRWYPGWVYAARKGLDPEITRKVAEAMTALSLDAPEHRPILENARLTEIIRATDKDFDPVRELAERIGMDLGR
ncbi:phosphonate transport system substrate-binding protein [Desulfobaculum xiamenense]|uniref:Phosphonate transport system substrate-binding protein n=1 Tax=Desulfobaculum xiamenense TaxID=995050 RepID=A0A846QLV8_9BACT|nr:phosphate/phosphite/phosphonate ABC transporter substrate-binding protein [Desulfobaculum xiamenense]NJB69091.1 phosphonate transport system substrate-binding protein [Desulfobaculum xiamenense]